MSSVTSSFAASQLAVRAALTCVCRYMQAFGVGNMPDAEQHGWLPWLTDQRSKGVQVRTKPSCSRRRLQG